MRCNNRKPPLLHTRCRLQDCLFRPVLVAAPKAKEGRAIKLAAELTQVGRGWQAPLGGRVGGGRSSALCRHLTGVCCPALQSKRATAEEEAPAGAAQQEAPPGAAPTGAKAKARGGAKAGSGGAAGKGEGALQFDHLERQINEALVRLSLSEEQVAASLRQAHSGGGPAPPPPPLALAGAQGEWRCSFSVPPCGRHAHHLQAGHAPCSALARHTQQHLNPARPIL